MLLFWRRWSAIVNNTTRSPGNASKIIKSGRGDARDERSWPETGGANTAAEDGPTSGLDQHP